MNKEKEIDRMELLLVNDILLCHNAEETAAHLHKYGIGDKKQAVKEFAEKLKNTIEKCIVCYPNEKSYCYNNALGDVIRFIDKLITELYGANE